VIGTFAVLYANRLRHQTRIHTDAVRALLVDDLGSWSTNAIVVVENVRALLSEGYSRREAVLALDGRA